MEEADQKERERPRLSSDSRTEGPKQGMASSSIRGNLNEGVLPEEGVVSRPLPWWVLHGRGYVSH